MKPRKHGWRIAIVVCVLCVGIVLVELGTLLIRGYGFLGTIIFMPEPYNETMKDLRPVGRYIGEYLTTTYLGSEPLELMRWPDPNEIAKKVDTIRLSTNQPYKEFDIYIFESISRDARYLYAPLTVNTRDPLA